MRSMLRAALPLLSVGAVACGNGNPGSTPTPSPTPSAPPSVLEHHAGPRRSGLYTLPTLTRAAAATMHMDSSFAGIVKGDVYAQPLYVPNGPGGHGTFFVATEDDEVDALDEATGATIWSRSLGTAAPRTGAGCGSGSRARRRSTSRAARSTSRP